MSLQHAILGVIEARPMTGYELARFFDATAGWVWSAPQSQIYPTLKKMAANGLIARERQVRGRRLERNLYSITEAGRAELVEWVSTPASSTHPRDRLLLTALHLDTVEIEVAEKILTRVIDDQLALVEEWRTHAARLRAMDTPLLVVRLRSRPPQEHEHIARLKAAVFEGGALLARTRADWARAGLAILQERAERCPGEPGS